METQHDLRPLFVLGVQRSGTTWLANALCNHPQIAGVQAAEHFGIVESWYFSHLRGRFDPLDDEGNYQRFLDMFSRTAFFQTAPLDRSVMEPWFPTTYARFFDDYMAAVLKDIGEGRGYWLEKTPTHTLHAEQLLQDYPQAKFIGITREFAAVFQSQWSLYLQHQQLPSVSQPGWRAIASRAYYWAKYLAYLKSFAARHGDHVYVIEYESLVQNQTAVLGACLDFLGLSWDDRLLEQKYRRNASGTSKNHYEMSPEVEQRIHFVGNVMRRLPAGLFQLQERLRRPRTQDPVPFLSA